MVAHSFYRILVFMICLSLFSMGTAVAEASTSPDIIKKGYADTSLGQIHYRYTSGPQKAPALVLLHQVTDDSVMFEAMMQRLHDKYSKIVALDFPGYGGSFQATDEQVTGISFYADVFMQALESIGIEKAHILGHHTGGCIALDMKSRWPDRFTTLTIIGPIYGDQKFRKDLRAITTADCDGIIPKRDGSHLLKGWKMVQSYGAGNVPLEMHQRTAMTTIIGWKYEGRKGMIIGVGTDIVSVSR